MLKETHCVAVSSTCVNTESVTNDTLNPNSVHVVWNPAKVGSLFIKVFVVFKLCFIANFIFVMRSVFTVYGNYNKTAIEGVLEKPEFNILVYHLFSLVFIVEEWKCNIFLFQSTSSNPCLYKVLF